MKNILNFLCNNKLSIVLFAAFAILNLYFFIKNFFETFFNVGSNADEYYEGNLYSISNITINKIFYTPSQFYIFISSIVNSVIDSPKISVRLVSLMSCAYLFYYFIRKMKSISLENDFFLERIYKISFFVCAVLITNQMFVGTSDFLSVVFLVFAFFLVLRSISLSKNELSNKDSIVVGILLALAVATRPTAIVLIFSFYFSILMILGFRNIFLKQNYLIGLIGILVFILINIFPIIEQNKVILDIKEIPEETGVNWFQRNYLMAKFWDEGKLPNTQWIGTIDVINYKKENPDFVFPKNQIDLLMKEPGLFGRQLFRMFIKGCYSSFRYMYLFFPLLLLMFIDVRKYNHILNPKNNKVEKSILINKIVVVTHFLSMIIFSFLAVKMLEFRWLITTLILYVYYSINYLPYLNYKTRFLIYNLSFFSGIILYVIFFIKEGL